MELVTTQIETFMTTYMYLLQPLFTMAMCFIGILGINLLTLLFD